MMTAMYTVVVESQFSAIHHVRMRDGRWEEPHGHDWLVRAYFCRRELDGADMVVDLGEATTALGSVLERLHHRNLNEHPALAGRNPTAEVVAEYILNALTELPAATLRRVEVTEAPGCVAIVERVP